MYNHNNHVTHLQKMNRIPSPKMLTLDPNDENIILEIPDDVNPTQADTQDAGGKKEKVGFLYQQNV